MTDGLEDASQKYTATQIANLIKHQREAYKWEFLFLGANQCATLSPHITEIVLSGKHPELTLQELLQNVPIDWPEQLRGLRLAEQFLFNRVRKQSL